MKNIEAATKLKTITRFKSQFSIFIDEIDLFLMKNFPHKKNYKPYSYYP